jgi:hypothetical protein
MTSLRSSAGDFTGGSAGLDIGVSYSHLSFSAGCYFTNVLAEVAALSQFAVVIDCEWKTWAGL